MPAPLKISRVTIAGANTDGKNLFFDIDVFDGEHTNRLEPVFPVSTTGEAIVSYCKELIEKNPKLPDGIVNLTGTTIYFDNEEDSWYSVKGNLKPVREKGKAGTVLGGKPGTPVVAPVNRPGTPVSVGTNPAPVVRRPL